MGLAGDNVHNVADAHDEDGDFGEVSSRFFRGPIAPRLQFFRRGEKHRRCSCEGVFRLECF